MLKLAWSEAALQAFEAIARYITDRNPAAAANLEARVIACTERLSEHPYMHRAGRLPGTREAVVHPNYILVYRVENDMVRVVGFLHTRRQYPPNDPE